jgi:UDP-N-acetylmuramoylalanine-D-glutamate ligase
MIKNKNILVVGGGNAGRPVANLFNFLGNNVVVNDINIFDNLPKKAREQIKILKNRGIEFELGGHDFINLDFFNYVFISPNISKNLEFIKKIIKYVDHGKLVLITYSDFGKILNSLISVPMVGVSGTDGKTSTVNIINFLFNEKFNSLIFSSLQNSLVIEGLVEMIVEENFNEKDNDIAIFELPHGTIRLVEGLELFAGVLTNLTPDHLDEFDSFKDYVDRNLLIDKLIKENGILIVNGDDPIISSRLNSFLSRIIVYGLNNPQKIEFEGELYYNENVNYDIFVKDIKLDGLNGSVFTIESNGFNGLICKNCNQLICSCNNYEPIYIDSFVKNLSIVVPGICNIENCLSTLVLGLLFGLNLDYIISRLSKLNGIKGRFEKIENINGVNIFMDAAHNPESMDKLFNGLDISGRLIVSLDNPDTLTIRDKRRIGRVLSKYCDVLIISSRNETTEIINRDASLEVLDGAGEIEAYITDSVDVSIFKSLLISKSGDTIIHIGPGVVNAYNSVKNDIKEALKFFKSISGEVFVIGGCGNVGSLMARILNDHGFNVTISDISSNCKLKKVFKNEGIKLDLGGYNEELLKHASSFFIAESLKNNNNINQYLKKIANVPIYSVDNILKFFKPYKDVFAITGTNGKTSTKEYLKNIFKTAGLMIPEHELNIQGNSEFIPMLQSRLKGDLAVIEIGTFGNIGEIKKAAENSEVNIGIITNVSKDHIQNDFKDYVTCKKEMVDFAPNLILNGDDPIVTNFINLKNKKNIIFFGINQKTFENKIGDFFKNKLDNEEKCPVCNKKLNYFDNTNYDCSCGFKKPRLDVEANNIEIVQIENKLNTIKYNLKIFENQGEIYLKNSSIVNVYNSLAAAAAAYLAGINFEDILKGINTFDGVPGRFEIIHENPLIILDFAHNPSGVKSILQGVLNIKESLNSISNKKKSQLIVINTISSESGDEGDKEIAQLLSSVDINIPASNQAFIFSKFIKSKIIPLKSKIEYKKTGTIGATKEQVEEAIKIALEIVSNNDIILIIGEAGEKYCKDILNQLL